MRSRTPWGSASRSQPTTRAEPAVGCSSVVSIRSVVVLPAPFGPRKPTISPGSTTKSTPPTASIRPCLVVNARASPRASMIGTCGLVRVSAGAGPRTSSERKRASMAGPPRGPRQQHAARASPLSRGSTADHFAEHHPVDAPVPAGSATNAPATIVAPTSPCPTDTRLASRSSRTSSDGTAAAPVQRPADRSARRRCARGAAPDRPVRALRRPDAVPPVGRADLQREPTARRAASPQRSGPTVRRTGAWRCRDRRGRRPWAAARGRVSAATWASRGIQKASRASAATTTTDTMRRITRPQPQSALRPMSRRTCMPSNWIAVDAGVGAVDRRLENRRRVRPP